MFSSRHLQQKRQEFAAQYDVLSDKIKRWRLDLAIEAGSAVKYQLEKQIEQAEQERDRIVNLIQFQERSLEIERIRNALYRLNYFKQVRLFGEFRQERRIGAFLVHGLPEHGQIFLLKRLLDLIPESSVTPPIHFCLKSRILRKNVEVLWGELARDMGLQNYSSHEEIAKGVVARLQTQHVILVFQDLDCIYEDYLQQLLSDFWLPLVNSIQQTIYTTNEYFLLMFLVDHEGCVSTWDVKFADRLDSVWKPDTPIRLPIIDCLSDRVLANWIENAINELPPKLIKEEIDCTVQLILEKSKGIPERVFAEIFDLCGCNRLEGEKLWSEL